MHYRTLGRTRLKVGIIGFGAWGIGKGLWVGAEDDVSLRALKVQNFIWPARRGTPLQKSGA